MSEFAIAAVVYADGVYPDRAIAQAIDPLRDSGLPLAGALQVEPVARGRHPCDMLLEDLASGQVHAIAEDRGSQAQGCRLDVGLLTEIGVAVLTSVRNNAPRLLVVNKFGRIEADGGGLRDAIGEAVERQIPSWSAFRLAISISGGPSPVRMRPSSRPTRKRSRDGSRRAVFPSGAARTTIRRQSATPDRDGRRHTCAGNPCSRGDPLVRRRRVRDGGHSARCGVHGRTRQPSCPVRGDRGPLLRPGQGLGAVGWPQWLLHGRASRRLGSLSSRPAGG